MTELVSAMAEARQRFIDLVAELRPELHRYCARMTGSVFDGEDVVQETLAKAYYALAAEESLPPLRPWLFRIAHNTAVDFVRRYEHRHVELPGDLEPIMHRAHQPEDPAPDDERVEAALHVFAALPPLQRSALAFKDVLELSLEDTAAAMSTTVPAVKAALVRARATVALANAASSAEAHVDVKRLRRYADLFNARDWDGLRALFVRETELEVVGRHQRRGAAAAQYFTRYAEVAAPEDLRAEAGWVDGTAVLAIFRPAASARPAYFVQLVWVKDCVSRVRDFRYVPYIAAEAAFRSA